MEKPKYSMTNQIYTLSFHESSPSKDNNRKEAIQGWKSCPRKKQQSNPSTNQKEDSHKNRMPTLTTKIKGSNNYFSLISLNINWTCKLYMPQYRGMPGPKSGSWWVGVWGGGYG
jgi:redox-sensitive bicupin YhaK (pirin superfamily)